jgi:hypothetical protein
MLSRVTSIQSSHGEPCAWRHLVSFQQGGDGQYLLHRARLIHVAQRPGTEPALIDVRRHVVGIEGRVVGEREQLTGGGVHDDD